MYYEYPFQKEPVVFVRGLLPALDERPFDFSPPPGEDIKHPPVQFHPNSVWRKYEKPSKIRNEHKIRAIVEDPRWDSPRRFPVYKWVHPWDCLSVSYLPRLFKDRLSIRLGAWVYHVAIQTDESFNARTNRLVGYPMRCKVHRHGRYFRFHKLYSRPSSPELLQRVVWRIWPENPEDALQLPVIYEDDYDELESDGDDDDDYDVVEPKSYENNNSVISIVYEDLDKKVGYVITHAASCKCQTCSPLPLPLKERAIDCYDKCIQTRMSFLMGNRIVDYDVPASGKRSPYPIDSEALDIFVYNKLYESKVGRYMRALRLVFTYLRPEEVLVASRVSKLWSYVATHKKVWKKQILDVSIGQAQVERVLKFAPRLKMVHCRHLYVSPQKWRIRNALLATYCDITKYRVYRSMTNAIEQWSLKMMRKLSTSLTELELFDVSWNHLKCLESMPNLRKLSVWSTRPVHINISEVKVGWSQLTHLKTNIHPQLTRSLLEVHCQTLENVTIETPPPKADDEDSLLDLFLENSFPELWKLTIKRYCLPHEEARCDREIEALRSLLEDVEVETTPHTGNHSDRRRFYQALPQNRRRPPSPPPLYNWDLPEPWEPQPLNWVPIGHHEDSGGEDWAANAG